MRAIRLEAGKRDETRPIAANIAKLPVLHRAAR